MITTKFTTVETFPSGIKVTMTFNKSLDEGFKLAKNFTVKELANNLATETVKAVWNDDVKLHTVMLQRLRDTVGVMNVSSWYRTPSFNKKVGGSSNSLHTRALATDVKWPKMTAARRKQVRNAWEEICKAAGVIGGINYYTNGVHLSSREDLLGYKSFVVRDYRGTSGDW